MRASSISLACHLLIFPQRDYSIMQNSKWLQIAAVVLKSPLHIRTLLISQQNKSDLKAAGILN